MAGSARGSILIVDPDYPLAFVHIHLVAEGLIKDAMLRFLVHFDLRMIRTKMAFAAGIGASCLFL